MGIINYQAYFIRIINAFTTITTTIVIITTIIKVVVITTKCTIFIIIIKEININGVIMFSSFKGKILLNSELVQMRVIIIITVAFMLPFIVYIILP